MTTFAVIWDYAGGAAVTEALRAAHGEHIRQLVENGALLEAGSWADGSGALLVFSTEDRAELDSLIAADPYMTSGVVARNDIREWHVVHGLVTR